jgi:hypothetical protein
MFKRSNRARARFSLLSAAMVWAAASAQAADDSAHAWYVGTFSGAVVDSGSTTRIVLDCRSQRECAVEMTTTSDGAAPATHRPDMGEPRPMSAQLPNGELQGVKAAIKDEPGLMTHPRFGQMLTRLQPLINGGDKLAACFDLTADATESMGVCSLSSGAAAKESLVMVLATMNGSCGNLPFCAYYLIPLTRQGGGR